MASPSPAASAAAAPVPPSREDGGRPFVDALLPLPRSSRHRRPRPRVVLLQHTLGLPARMSASSSSAASSSSGGRRMRRAGGADVGGGGGGGGVGGGEDEVYRRAGLRTPSESARRDLAGGLFVVEALGRLATRTGGRVVWVRATDNLALPPDEEGDGGTTTGGMEGRAGGCGWAGSFRRFGTTVDLASDPLGWDDDGDDGGGNDEDGDDGARRVRTYPSRMDDLEGVAAAVERAAAASGLDPRAEEDGPGLIDEAEEEDFAKEAASASAAAAAAATAAAGIESSDGPAPADGRTDAPPAVPVIFDSIVPLLTMHGAGRTVALLRRLAGGGTAAGRTNDGDCGGDGKDRPSRAQRRRGEPHLLLSPVVVPILTEAVRPCDLRRLEDEADAVLTLLGGEMRTVRKGGGGGGGGAGKGGHAGRLISDVQPFRVESSSGDGARRRAAAELILGPEGGNGQLRGGAEGAAAAPGVAVPPAATARSGPDAAAEAPPLPSSWRTAQPPPSQRPRPTLRHEEGGREGPAGPQSSMAPPARPPAPPRAGAPRIFVQDDDPEYDDLDEEDLDDDLDNWKAGGSFLLIVCDCGL